MKINTIQDVITHLESYAPPQWQESYDNCGLLTGDAQQPISGVLLTLDCTTEVVEEAVQSGCNLIISHHPIIFSGIKRLTGRTYVERTLILAIRNNIAIYAAHTNWDNFHRGVNLKIAEKIKLKNCRVLVPKSGNLLKLVTFIPKNAVEKVSEALYKAGAGKIGKYDMCRFGVEGEGTFRPLKDAAPTIGKKLQLEKVREVRAEYLIPAHAENVILKALKDHHPYEEVAYYLTALENKNQETGSGLIGQLDKPIPTMEFLQQLKSTFHVGCIKYTSLVHTTIQTVALCGGSGSFLLADAQSAGADIFISADFKYHEYFDAERIIIADIGHYESEQFTIEIFHEVLKEKFNTFAVNFSYTNTNPISYL